MKINCYRKNSINLIEFAVKENEEEKKKHLSFHVLFYTRMRVG